MRDQPAAACPGFRWSCLREVTTSVAAHYAREPERPNPREDHAFAADRKRAIRALPRVSFGTRSGHGRTRTPAIKHLRCWHWQGIMVSKNPRPSGCNHDGQKRRPHQLSADGAARNWLRGQDLNLRPSGYEGGSTQPADGRRPSCFQSSRVVDSSAESTKVHAGIRGSLPVWTRFGQGLQASVRELCLARPGRSAAAARADRGKTVSPRYRRLRVAAIASRAAPLTHDDCVETRACRTSTSDPHRLPGRSTMHRWFPYCWECC